MKYFLIAGEASGDLHGSALIDAIRRIDPQAQFRFLGGEQMAASAGCPPVIHYRDMAYMGFSEVLRHLRGIYANLRMAKKFIAEYHPDRMILIDYPGFNLKIAGFAHKAGLEVCWYISPKVWAWKEWRVKSLRKYVSRMACIFPFEVDFFARRGYEVTYVGNPSVSEVQTRIAAVPPRAEFLEKNRLRDRPIVALLPGSRRSEIKNNLRIMVSALDRFPQYRGVVAGAPGIDSEYYKEFTGLPVVFGQTYPLLAHAHAALVTSGTATLETAIARVPQVVLYRANGSRLSYNIMKRLLKVEHVSLPNLIAGATIIPEMLLHYCTSDLVADELAPLLRRGERRDAMLAAYDVMLGSLGTADAAAGAAALFCR